MTNWKGWRFWNLVRSKSQVVTVPKLEVLALCYADGDVDDDGGRFRCLNAKHDVVVNWENVEVLED